MCVTACCAGLGLSPAAGKLSSIMEYKQGPVVGRRAWCACALETGESKKRMFIFGMGYAALALAAWLKRQNWTVSGTCRSLEKKAALQLRGYPTFLFNPDNDGQEMQEEGFKALRNATHILSTVPPVGDFDKDPVLDSHYQDLAQLGALGKLQWIGMLSSTGVYGDHGGEWVDEEYEHVSNCCFPFFFFMFRIDHPPGHNYFRTEVRPRDRSARARVEAEKRWLQLGNDMDSPVQIFRLGGIYGPGRSAWDSVVQTAPLSARQKLRGGRQYTSRVHVADICQVVLASIQQPCAGRVFNVVDDDPAPRSVVFQFARELRESCGVSTTYKEEDSVPVSTAGKRVANRRIKDELLVKLLYPSYKEGLRAIADGVKFPFEDDRSDL